MGNLVPGTSGIQRLKGREKQGMFRAVVVRVFHCGPAASGLGGVQYMGYYAFEPSSQANHTNLCTRLRARHPR